MSIEIFLDLSTTWHVTCARNLISCIASPRLSEENLGNLRVAAGELFGNECKYGYGSGVLSITETAGVMNFALFAQSHIDFKDPIGQAFYNPYYPVENGARGKMGILLAKDFAGAHFCFSDYHIRFALPVQLSLPISSHE